MRRQWKLALGLECQWHAYVDDGPLESKGCQGLWAWELWVAVASLGEQALAPLQPKPSAVAQAKPRLEDGR